MPHQALVEPQLGLAHRLSGQPLGRGQDKVLVVRRTQVEAAYFDLHQFSQALNNIAHYGPGVAGTGNLFNNGSQRIERGLLHHRGSESGGVLKLDAGTAKASGQCPKGSMLVQSAVIRVSSSLTTVKRLAETECRDTIPPPRAGD